MTIPEESLNMDHLATDEEMKEAVSEKIVPESEKAEVDKKDPRDEEKWTFHFSWTDTRDVVHAGHFTNHILSMGETQAVAVLEAQFAGGMPAESIPEDVRVLNKAIATMSYSLTDRPPWAKNLRGVKDAALIMKLWEKVASHEARYFRYDKNQS